MRRLVAGGELVMISCDSTDRYLHDVAVKGGSVGGGSKIAFQKARGPFQVQVPATRLPEALGPRATARPPP